MITAAIVNVWCDVLAALIGLAPHIDPPAFLGDVTTWATEVGTHAGPAAQFVPWSLTVDIFTAVGTIVVGAITFRLVRVGVSYFTGGGGAA